jgi:hypothetical protein
MVAQEVVTGLAKVVLPLALKEALLALVVEEVVTE